IDNLDQRLKMSCYYESGVGQYAEIQAFDNAETGYHNLLLNRQGGTVLIATTSTDPAGANGSGTAIKDYISVSRSGGISLYLNRKTNDGDIAGFYQDGVLEGSISVAGNTVSYNAFLGSHWSQLIDQSINIILKGTVMETIDDFCVWDDIEHDRLVKVKISDTIQSKRVYGVFSAWDKAYSETGDMYIASLGVHVVRINKDVIVNGGDLLESAGDGTANIQSDDIIKSSTIGKVLNNKKIITYDDGSYLVSCALMCG
ncbi:hypothetical protein EB118_12690, partial [bacterium]|nr:hypothetical protein [bacterium]